ncbi:MULTISPECIES: transcriptional regulator PerR [Clostridium]|jgi:Fur family peroxide stress response transcriptional regulator|uniref:Fe2+/Zn2+ uptake regulation protein n=1 Tax=Clostridium saccharoperbutylacetonicum N1-4(HMT) TaxID=931276 RepID=M1LR11_9CLOT|nr:MULTISPECIES: Fur family transcriptional regulator [Clostridium]AGF55325.1 Fe2+/Zn2+ uptake regulation protein [Clostridium saccharoperbutylacetonicum N1-4(HMT)]AQR94211.1 transcriptional regulator PerR [Clostridium saccharoperbutylacetonicum]NRT63962.1 Fur family peroxide stress response transcriptional regulator [Clostridium saccharoperbutylacetonicum]NSB27329.1 Fur family peroxide stress response transcriptional regulator [Clostridium saccharoperbutylacetonicum]NSB29911.1 Fur family pero
MDYIASIFKEKKLKLTPQRLAVYNYLLNTTSHPSADVIYTDIHVQYPTMSLATVYKALKTLVEVGLIQEINVGEGNFRYDGNSAPHPHLQCLGCGKVDDFKDLTLDNLNSLAETHTDYRIVSNKVYFYGYCTNCQ